MKFFFALDSSTSLWTPRVLLLCLAVQSITNHNYSGCYAQATILTRNLDLQNGAVTLNLQADTTAGTLQVDMVYAGLAWLGFAFSNDAYMPDSVAVIVQPPDDASGATNTVPEVYSLTSKDITGVNVVAANSYALTSSSYTQNNTHTTLSFVKPLVQDGFPTVSTMESNYFLYAVGTSNTLGYHAFREALQVNLSEQGTTGSGSSSGGGGDDTGEDDNDKDETGEDDSDEDVESEDSTAGSGSGVIDLGNGRLQHSLELENGDLQLVFVTDETAGTLTVTMTYAGLNWIAVAFSKDQLMIGSLAVIALPGTSGAVPQKYDLFSKSDTGVVLASQQTLQDATLNQNDTHTTMTFTKLLQEEGEPTISLTESNNFLYAMGSSNALGFHAARNSFAYNFADANGSVVVSASSSQNLWKAHGICMALAWAILVPLAIASSVIRDILPLPDGMWFQIHRGLNTLGVALTIAGFGIAVHLFNEVDAEHFSLETHHKVGLAIFILAVLQAMSGILRPHLPHNPEPDEEPQPSAKKERDSSVRSVEVGESDFMTEPGAADTTKEEPPQEKSKKRQIWEYQHRILGTATLVLGWYNCSSGIDLYSRNFDSEDRQGALWGVIAGITVTTFVLALYINCVKKRQQ